MGRASRSKTKNGLPLFDADAVAAAAAEDDGEEGDEYEEAAGEEEEGGTDIPQLYSPTLQSVVE